jgi:hypothetical protein
MQKVFVFFAVSLTFVLAACSSLIPDQKVENVFGLDGKSVTLEQVAQSGLTQSELGAQQVSVVYSGALSATFNDLDQDLPGGIRPSGISESVGIQANLSVASATANEAAFPTTLSITASQLSFTLTDGSGNPNVSQSFNSSAGLNLVLTKGTCTTGATGTSCTYTTNAVSAILLVAQLVGSNFSTFFDIISGGGEPNTLMGNFSLTLVGDSLFPADSRMTVVLQTSEGTLTF